LPKGQNSVSAFWHWYTGKVAAGFKNPGQQIRNDTGSIANAGNIPGVTGAVDAATGQTPDVFSFLHSQDSVVRIAEFLVGSILLTVGLVHLMKSGGSIQKTGKQIYSAGGTAAKQTQKAVGGKASTAKKAAKAAVEVAAA
jgi:hypothetical protein